MRLQSTRFGELTIEEETALAFPRGLMGYPEQKEFFLLEQPSQGPFKWLHALDDTSLAFVMIDPTLIKPDFRLNLQAEELEEMQATDPTDLRIYVMLTVSNRHPEKATANLQGPILLNMKARKGKQLVLLDTLQYPCRYPLFPQKSPASMQETGAEKM